LKNFKIYVHIKQILKIIGRFQIFLGIFSKMFGHICKYFGKFSKYFCTKNFQKLLGTLIKILGFFQNCLENFHIAGFFKFFGDIVIFLKFSNYFCHIFKIFMHVFKIFKNFVYI
jgi:hypothetical protein